jgi:hypothetical protein
MATAATLANVIDRMRAEGDLDRNSGTNSIKSLKETVTANSEQTRAYLKDISFGQNLQIGRFDELIEILTGDSLKNLEAERENRALFEEIADHLADINKNDGPMAPTNDKESPSGISPLAGLTAAAIAGGILKSLSGLLAGAIGGIVVGAIKGEFKLLQGFFKLIIPEAFTSKLAQVGDDLVKSFKGFALGATMKLELVLDGLKTTAGGLFDKFKASAIGEFISGKLEGIKTWAGSLVDGIKGMFSWIPSGTGSGIMSKISETLQPIKNFFSTIGDGIGKVLDLVKPIATVVEKLFVPLAAIMTVFDVISGAIEGYDKEGFIGGVKGAITGLFEGLVGGLADLIKDGVSWLLDLMGFDQFSEKLDSFSFTEEFGKLIDSLFDNVGNLFTSAKDKIIEAGSSIGSTMSDMGAKINEYLKKILRSVLPDPTADYDFDDPKFYLRKIIPDAIYEYAGINPETGEEIISAAGGDALAGNTQGTLGGMSAGVINEAGGSANAQPIIVNQIAAGSGGGSGTTNVSAPSQTTIVQQSYLNDSDTNPFATQDF